MYNRMSVEAMNILTLENEEYTHGLDDCLSLSDLFPTVLDIHHHWIREGEYIQANDDRIKKVIDSWRGVRPTIHYSVSREDVLVNHPVDVLPDHNQLTIDGFKKAKLRAHSDYMWSDAVNDWAKTHWEWADVMVESKSKNLASFKLYEYWIS
jgi:UV DNA damage repair endonuclease